MRITAEKVPMPKTYIRLTMSSEEAGYLRYLMSCSQLLVSKFEFDGMEAPSRSQAIDLCDAITFALNGIGKD